MAGEIFGSILGSLFGGISNVFAQNKQIREAKRMQEYETINNRLMYEDWKHYNSLDERLKRAADAGVSKHAALGINDTLPQAFQTNNAIIPDDGGLGAFGQMLSSVGQSVDKASQTNFDREQKKLDNAYRAEALKLQWENLKALREFREKNLSQQKWMFGLRSGWEQDKINIARDSLQFKKDFYGDPNYLGYWQTQQSKQLYHHRQLTNPIEVAILRNRKTMSDEDTKWYSTFKGAHLSMLQAQAQNAARMANMNSELYEKQLAAQEARLNAITSNPNNTKAGQWINYGLGVANQMLDIYSGLRGFGLRKSTPTPEPRQGWAKPANYYYGEEYDYPSGYGF